MSTLEARLENIQGGRAESISTNEQLLVAQSKSGHTGAFGELYERYRPRLYRSAFGILRNRPDAEDAVQRAFQCAFINLDGFREDSTFSTWVTRIAINEALMLLRQRRITSQLSEPCDDNSQANSALGLVDERPSPEQAVADNELSIAVKDAVSRLRESLRSVVVLHYLQGLTSAEIAQLLGLSIAAVKGRIFHARRHLRRRLEQNYKFGNAMGCLNRRRRTESRR